MVRLPTPGGDNGDWGDILNAFLEISHAADGTLNNNTVGTNQIQSGAVTDAQLDSSTQSAITLANSSVQSVNGQPGPSVTLTAPDVSAVPSSQLGAANGVATLDSNATLTTDQLPSSVVSVSGQSTNQVPQWNGSSWAAVNVGGGNPGTATVHKFPFTFDTPNLTTGATAVFVDGYTIATDDILMDAWIEIDTAWDGTTPLGDYGYFADNYGFLGNTSGTPSDMTVPDDNTTFGGNTTPMLSQGDNASSPNDLRYATLITNGTEFGVNYNGLPAKFTAADPLLVVVSQDGTNTGADPGSTQGAAVLYIVTATPGSSSSGGGLTLGTNSGEASSDSSLLLSADGQYHSPSVLMASPPSWLDTSGNIIEPGIYTGGLQIVLAAAFTTPGLYISILALGGDSESYVPCDALNADGVELGSASVVHTVPIATSDGLPFNFSGQVKMPTDATGKVNVYPFIYQVAA